MPAHRHPSQPSVTPISLRSVHPTRPEFRRECGRTPLGYTSDTLWFSPVTSHESPITKLQIRPFVFNNFHDAPPPTPFFSNRASDKDASPERPQQVEGSLIQPPPVLTHFALCYPPSFHSIPNCSFCNSFVLITIRITQRCVPSDPPKPRPTKFSTFFQVTYALTPVFSHSSENYRGGRLFVPKLEPHGKKSGRRLSGFPASIFEFPFWGLRVACRANPVRRANVTHSGSTAPSEARSAVRTVAYWG